MTNLPDSPRIRLLQRCIRGMLLLLLLGFVYVLFSSLGGPAINGASSDGDSLSVFDDVQIGQTTMRRFNGERVWATRLSMPQRQQAKSLDAVVKDTKAGCKPSAPICVVGTKTQRDGIEVMFSESAPAQLDGSFAWFGGYVDPVSGAVFDRLGRAYRAAGDVKVESDDLGQTSLQIKNLNE